MSRRQYSSGRSGYSSSGFGGYSSSSGSSRSSSSSGLHYKKDGTLDMRYSSSKQAVASGYSGGYGGNASGYASPAPSSSSSSQLHYKRDGTLDMRYTSSKQAVASAYAGGGAASAAVPSSSDLHYKKDGTLDMRYTSSKQAVAAALGGGGGSEPSPSDLHYKKDGTLDMRFTSSKQAVATGMTQSFGQLRVVDATIPADVPVTSKGFPDMRFKAAKEWVAAQAKSSGAHIPSFIPMTKRGEPDMQSPVTRAYLAVSSSLPSPRPRAEYYRRKKAEVPLFAQALDECRRRAIAIPEVWQVPEPDMAALLERVSLITKDVDAAYQAPLPSQDAVANPTNVTLAPNQASTTPSALSPSSPVIDLAEVTMQEEIGSGGFGVVMKGIWKGREVAVKQVREVQLTKKDMKIFDKEVTILTLVGCHPNIVELLGHCKKPCAIIMECLPYSLSNLLHFNEDPVIEASMSDGRTKRKILCGAADGLLHLHNLRITHGDIKPQNILVTADFTAKIADFGLASLRGKVSSSMAADPSEGGIGGTAGYMAPELLGESSLAGPSTDVYSFGVVMNEVVVEEEPYNQYYRDFQGKGPFAAALFAKSGKRPVILPAAEVANHLIASCWQNDPSKRPSMAEVVVALHQDSFVIPDSC